MLVVLSLAAPAGALAAATDGAPPRGASLPATMTAYVSQYGGACTSPTGACSTLADALLHSGAADLALIMDIELHPSGFTGLEVLDHNVTIRSLDCVGIRTINFSFLKAKVLLADWVTVTFQRVKLAHARLVSDASIDLFVGGLGGAVVLRDSQHYRPAGMPPAEVAALTTAYPRPARFPGRQRVTQLTRGCTDDVMADIVYDDLAMRLGGPGKSGGPGCYDLHIVNVTRLCKATIPADCMKELTRDECISRAAIASAGRQLVLRGRSCALPALDTFA